MISKRQKFCIVFFMTRSLFLGLGVSLATSYAKQDAWISCILGTLIGYIFVYLIHYILKRKQRRTITETLKDIKGLGLFLRIILILLACFLILENIILLQIYTTSFFLIRTPIIFISITMMLLVVMLANKGLKVIGRVSEILFPISVVVIVIILLSMIPLNQFENFLPILTSSPMAILKSSIVVAATGVVPYVFLLIDKGEEKMPSMAYGFAMLTILGVFFSTISVLGSNLANIFRFPEYMVLKNIEIFNFIEKIENILSIVWIFDMFILLSMATLFLKTLLPQKHHKVWFYGLIIFLVYISSYLFGINYFLDLGSYYIYPYASFGLLLLVVIPLFFYAVKVKKRRKLRSLN